TALHILRIIQEESMKDNSAQIVAQVPVDVATFLLNEKRADIQGLEARLKVNVVLVPNIHLETPNYTVTRLRHDELNNSEPLPASFDMVEKPDEDDAAQKKVEESKQPRQEAAVKGVTPGQPAPMQAIAVPPPVPSLWRRVLSWFESPAAPEPEKKPAARSERDSRGQRDQPRGNRRNRDDERREPRQGGEARENRKPQEGGRQQPRQERPAPAQAEGQAGGQQNNSRRRDRSERGEQGARPEREQRPPRDGSRQREQRPPRPAPENQAPAADAPAMALTENIRPAGEGERPPRRERGDRRNRGERAPRSEQTARTSQADAQVQESAALVSTEQAMILAPVAGPTAAGVASYNLAHGAPMGSTPVAAAPPPMPVLVTAPAAAAAAVPAASAPVAAPAPAVAEKRAPPPVVRAPQRTLAPVMAPVEVKPYVLPPNSGLVMVETAADRARAAQSIAAEPAAPPAPPTRTRPPRPVIAAEPLVMVETVHKE
ncbi:MAG: ribonuclease E/G, partial [Acidobacteriota bacterium]